MCSCDSSRSAGCYTTHTAGGSNHRLGVHLLDNEEETITKYEDQFKVKMHVLTLNIMQMEQRMTH